VRVTSLYRRALYRRAPPTDLSQLRIRPRTSTGADSVTPFKSQLRIRPRTSTGADSVTPFKSQLLYQLSYAGAPHIVFGKSAAACHRGHGRPPALLSNCCQTGNADLSYGSAQETPFRSAWSLAGPVIQQPDIGLVRDATPSVVVALPTVPLKGSRKPTSCAAVGRGQHHGAVHGEGKSRSGSRGAPCGPGRRPCPELRRGGRSPRRQRAKHATRHSARGDHVRARRKLRPDGE